MKGLVRWAINNTPAMNVLMIAILLVGTLSLVIMRREVFPEFELEIILVSVPYPGASPEEVEEGICQKIEEAVRSVDGIKKVTSVAKEGAGNVILEVRASVPDVQKILNEVRSQVDRIPSFPLLAEDPEIEQITFRESAIKVGVLAPKDGEAEIDEVQLRELAEQIREELLSLGAVSQVVLPASREFQLDVEISEETLRKYGLTLDEAARVIGRENIELPGGTIKTPGQEILLRGKNKGLRGQDVAKIPLVTDPSGVVLSVGDLATIQDDFADTTAINRVNGREAIVLSVERTSNEDLLALADQVNEYAKNRPVPPGYVLDTWGDRSVEVRDRLNMLVENGTMGLLLVFLVLAVFLELRLAFWVALGIPVALLGAGSVLLGAGQTLNMLSMFAFLMALGIVVDDAIVVGENVYAHRQMGKPLLQAAIDGTVEVVPSVMASVATTIVAFAPLLFVTGIMGKFIAVMPLAVIAMLIISLFESVFILPCHLAHRDNIIFKIFGVILGPLSLIANVFAWINRKATARLDWFIDTVYLPVLRWSIGNIATVFAGVIALLIVAAGFVQAEIVPFVFFPKLDGNSIQATITFPDGTPSITTNATAQRIEEAAWQLHEEYKAQGTPIVKLSYRSVGEVAGQGGPTGQTSSGSHVGIVEVELVQTEKRGVPSEEIISRWRDRVGEVAGVDSMTFGAVNIGPAGAALEMKLVARSDLADRLQLAVEETKQQLSTYDGVKDITDDSQPGKWEYQIQVKPRARSLGITAADLAETIRSSYYGAESMRLQRGRHEVKLMVRYPQDKRRSLADFRQIRVRTGDGSERPLTELAKITPVRGYSEINRVDQLRSVTISADVDEEVGNASKIETDLKGEFLPEMLASYPGVEVRWEGQQEQRKESIGSLMMGSIVAMLVMFLLLTFEFKSYLQPVMIMLIIPFGAIGAIAGHALMGLPLTLFSFFGLVALTGVVVNDSIVLIDFINHRVRDGMPVDEALLEAGQRRFRPVLLTSVTTIAGLLPILVETSLQAQILVPMATSLTFGLMLATLLVLFLVPCLYRLYAYVVPYSPEEHEEVATGDAIAQSPDMEKFAEVDGAGSLAVGPSPG